MVAELGAMRQRCHGDPKTAPWAARSKGGGAAANAAVAPWQCAEA